MLYLKMYGLNNDSSENIVVKGTTIIYDGLNLSGWKVEI